MYVLCLLVLDWGEMGHKHNLHSGWYIQWVSHSRTPARVGPSEACAIHPTYPVCVLLAWVSPTYLHQTPASWLWLVWANPPACTRAPGVISTNNYTGITFLSWILFDLLTRIWHRKSLTSTRLQKLEIGQLSPWSIACSQRQCIYTGEECCSPSWSTGLCK